MNFPTSLLSIFAKHGGTQDPADAVLEVPRSLVPVVEVPEVLLQLVTGTLSPEVQQTSFALESEFEAIFGGAAVNASLCILAPGVWDLVVNLAYRANFTSYLHSAGISIFKAGTSDGAGLANFGPDTNQKTQVIRHRIAHDHPAGFEIKMALGVPPAAGNKHDLIAHIWANRLG